MLIQNDQVLVISLGLQAKLALFQDYTALLLCASYWEVFWQSINLKKLFLSLLELYDAAKAEERLLSSRQSKQLNSVTNMAAKIDIDTLKT